MIEALLIKAVPWLIGVVVALFGFLAGRQSGKKAGKVEAETKQAKATLKGVKDARNARSEIDALDDAAVRDRARRRMRESAKR